MDYYQRPVEESSLSTQTSEPKKLKRTLPKGALIFFLVVIVGAGAWLWMRNSSTTPKEQPVVDTSVVVRTQAMSTTNTTGNATTTHATSTNITISNSTSTKELENKYEVKTDGVYYDGTLIKRADPVTFEYIGNGRAKDKTNIYNGLEIFSMENPKMFTPMKDDYYTEGSFKVFLTFFDADPKTIEHINCFYTKDAKHVYFYGKTVADADPATFEMVGGCYAKDAAYVYLEGEALYKADPATFEYLGLEYTKDAKHVYFYGNIVSGADPETFIYVGGDYAKDITNVYVEGSVVVGADPASCTKKTLKWCEAPAVK